MENRKDYVETQIEMLSNALRRLLDKILKLKTEGNLEITILKEANIEIENLTLSDLLDIEDDIFILDLVEKYHFTNLQIKIAADILYEFTHLIITNKNIFNKTKMLYKHYQKNELKTIDFITFSRLIELENNDQRC